MAPLEPKLIKPRPFSQASRRDPAEDLIGTEMWRFDGHRTPELKNDMGCRVQSNFKQESESYFVTDRKSQ